MPAIVRARRRLASPRRRRALARSLEQAVVDTRAWSGSDFSGEVEQVTRLLRGHHPSRVRGVALADRLVRDGAALPVGSTGREILRRESGASGTSSRPDAARVRRPGRFLRWPGVPCCLPHRPLPDR